DWGYLAYAVGFGGSMIWFGSSAGVALSNMYPQAKSVGLWLKHGWHVALAYVIGFFVLYVVLGWHPNAPHKAKPAATLQTPGAAVPAFGLLDAVSKGTLDGGHGVLVYHYGKQNALALWGSSPAFAMDANTLLAWHKYGGGKELLNKLYSSIGANVVSFPYGPM